jgi:NAD dependent epimerase/dehydratase family enzyme
VGVIVEAMHNGSLVGPLNASAPAPVTNREFTRSLGRALHRPAVVAVPPFALRAALGRELANELLLGSLRVLPSRLVEAGYRFEDPSLDAALRNVLSFTEDVSPR